MSGNFESTSAAGTLSTMLLACNNLFINSTRSLWRRNSIIRTLHSLEINYSKNWVIAVIFWLKYERLIKTLDWDIKQSAIHTSSWKRAINYCKQTTLFTMCMKITRVGWSEFSLFRHELKGTTQRQDAPSDQIYSRVPSQERLMLILGMVVIVFEFHFFSLCSPVFHQPRHVSNFYKIG